MRAALSQVSTLPAPLLTELEDYAAGKCTAVELWLTKVEEHLRGNSVESFRDFLASQGIEPLSAAFQGGVLASQGERRAEAWRLLGERLELCRELAVPTLVVACDVPAPLGAEDAQRVQVSLVQLARAAAQTGVRIAIEFQAGSAWGNNLQTAVAMIAEATAAGAERGMLGICLDAFHFHVGPSKLQDLELLNADNLFVVQLCDLADVPRELATDQHRILPGEGDIPIGQIVSRLRQINYEGVVTVETLNPQLWQVPPRQYGEIALTSLRMCLGQNDNG
ncbi:MAG: sugar phosphate isomerase/epimerase [Planctomycetales bacterium]|nr:sugar phosphate isomerase/epimerase [Planctomycetales bacterium]